MLHIVQVVVSGYAEIPTLVIDQDQAESAFVEGAKKHWPQLYSQYCDQNKISQDCLSSAKAFIKSFDPSEKTKINHWVVKPEDIGLDKLNLLLLGEGPMQERRKHLQSLAADVERKSVAVKKDMAKFFTKFADLVEHVNQFDKMLAGDQAVAGHKGEPGLPELPSAPPREEPEVLDEKYQTPEWQVFVGSIKNLCGGGWSEFPAFNRHDWRQEVYANLTSLEYWQWAATKIDGCIGKAKGAGYVVVEDAEHRGQYRFHTPEGIPSEISCSSQVQAWCDACLRLDGPKPPQG